MQSLIIYSSNTTEQRELKHFTLDHILADIPYLVSKVKEDLNSASSRVITFGTRIGGAVAVLARKRFPHIIDGAWSTSGLFQSVTADTALYNDIAVQLHTYGGTGANCTSLLSKALQQVTEIVAAKNNTALQKLFLIDPEAPMDLGNPQEVQYFYNVLFSTVRFYIHGIG